VTLSSGGGGEPLVCEGLTIPANKNVLVIDREDNERRPFFTIRRPIAAGGTETHTFAVEPGGSASGNDEPKFESRFLEVDPVSDPSFQVAPDHRLLYRGINVTDARLLSIQVELDAGVLLSTAARRGIPPAEARQLMLFGGPYEALDSNGNLVNEVATNFLQEQLDLLLLPDDEFFGFFEDDYDAMTSDQERVAIYHSFGQTQYDPVISLSQDWLVAENFAGGANPNRIILVFEVPVGDGTDPETGLEYAVTRLSGPDGPVRRRISDSRVGEVMYFDSLAFRRAWVFRLILEDEGDGFSEVIGATLIRTVDGQ
jgi:hypothetical protein